MMPLKTLMTFFLPKHAHLALVDEVMGHDRIVTLDNCSRKLRRHPDRFDAPRNRNPPVST